MVYSFERLSGKCAVACAITFWQSETWQPLTYFHGAALGNDIIQGGKVKANLKAT